jgi:hypothetical protein
MALPPPWCTRPSSDLVVTLEMCMAGLEGRLAPDEAEPSQVARYN